MPPAIFRWPSPMFMSHVALRPALRRSCRLPPCHVTRAACMLLRSIYKYQVVCLLPPPPPSATGATILIYMQNNCLIIVRDFTNTHAYPLLLLPLLALPGCMLGRQRRCIPTHIIVNFSAGFRAAGFPFYRCICCPCSLRLIFPALFTCAVLGLWLRCSALARCTLLCIGRFLLRLFKRHGIARFILREVQTLRDDSMSMSMRMSVLITRFRLQHNQAAGRQRISPGVALGSGGIYRAQCVRRRRQKTAMQL
jgi:hypothetical protein